MTEQLGGVRNVAVVSPIHTKNASVTVYQHVVAPRTKLALAPLRTNFSTCTWNVWDIDAVHGVQVALETALRVPRHAESNLSLRRGKHNEFWILCLCEPLNPLDKKRSTSLLFGATTER